MLEQLELETVKVEYEGNGVTWVYLNRPEKMNAMTPTLHREMTRVLTDLERDPDTKLIILTGAGRAYCAGQDIKENFRDREAERNAFTNPNSGPDWRFDILFYYSKPTIAMVNGWCCGGAFTHLFSCDFAVAAEEAQFCVSEINWGILPGGMVTKVLAEGLRYRDAMYAMLLAEPIDGKQAREMGLVNFTVPLADLRRSTLELADKILSKNQAAYMATKQVYKAVWHMDFAQSKAMLSAKSDQLRLSDPERGRQVGMREFLDKKSFKPGITAYPREAVSAES